MNLLANPVMMKLAIALVLGVLGVVVLGFALRFIRQSLVDSGFAESSKAANKSNEFDITLATYQSVIQQFKAQGQELERLRQQDRQRASTTENISEAVISNLTSGVVLFSPVGLVQQANPAAKRILGYASPYSLHARDIFRGATATRPVQGSLPEVLDRAAKTREAVQRMEVDYVTPQGEPRLLGVTISPVQDRAGALLGTACLISDLTEMNKMAQQVRLQDNMASLGEMSAGIAHEFKNSLATISGYSQMLAGESNPETREFAQKIALETNNLTRIVTDFLNFARPRGMQREPLNLIAMLNDCARENGLTLQLEAPAQCEVIGDATALRQVFSNLMRNSKEAARAGAEVAVSARVEQKEDRTVVQLSDNGSGIPKDKLDKIFIPFFTTKAEGTGLGLALVHRIITDHGGTVGVESSDRGTTFSITLPRAREAASSSAH
ncbi:MAG: two-component system sensor histidine kinase NtrB [Terriglobales bacterium]